MMMRCRRASNAFSSEVVISRCALALTAWRQSKGEPQRLGERIGDYLKRCRAMSHHWPFLSCSVRDIAADKVAQARLGFSRKSRGQNHNGSQCAGLAIDERISLIVVTPNLRGGERDKKSEEDAEGREQTRGDRFE